MKRKRAKKPAGKWVFVPDSEEEEFDRQMDNLAVHLTLFTTTFQERCNAVEQFQDYHPESELPEEGAWILVKKPPWAEYTVPPMSVWFAEPWPMESCGSLAPHRVKIITPRGDLGLFPHEFSRLADPSKYYEFIGQGMELKFFGGEARFSEALALKLFYIRSRGISKRDAIAMVFGDIKEHGVLWIETDRDITDRFGYEWPPPEILATHATTNHQPSKTQSSVPV